MTKLSKPTTYHGITFRSRLEADFARWFDGYGILWSYEQQGYKLSNGVCYLPDFFLPQQRAFFECKGVMDDIDRVKIITLAEDSGMDVIVGSHIYDSEPLLQMIDTYNENYSLIHGDITIAKCLKCGHVWIMSAWGSWQCRCCGHYEGNAGFISLEYLQSW